MDDEKFSKKIKSMNINTAKRASKVTKFQNWKQYDGWCSKYVLTNQSPDDNQNDNMTGNECNDR